MRARALGLLALAVACAAVADEPPLPEVAAALARVKDRSTVDLVTTGRRTGKPHRKPVWFVVDDGKILVQAGKSGKTDWYLNLLKTPAALVSAGDYSFQVRAFPVRDRTRTQQIHALFLKKYTSAWLLSFFGSSIGRGVPVELTPTRTTVRVGGT